MKTEIFEFKINQDKKQKIARHFDKSLSVSDTKEIDIIIDELEKEICKHVNEILKHVKIECESRNQNFNDFYDEVKKLL
jgi:hypothetical protein